MTTKTKTLRIAVLTDFHAFTSREGDRLGKPSWLDLNSDQSDVSRNPFAALKKLIGEDGTIKADVVACLGDMGDKASREGQQYVWSEVNKLREQLGAKHVIGAAGNHDVDSRFQSDDFDAKGQIQSLEPPFPVSDERKWLEYWAKNFTIVDAEGVRFLLLNSAAYHGAAKDPNKPEYLHGRVSDRTIEAIRRALQDEGARSANVLVCHHHPFRNEKHPNSDYSEMRGGDRLINSLTDAAVGPWLVLHGHKHIGRVFYAGGNNSSPTVFSAASFSARPYPNQEVRSFNEFYIVELQVPESAGAQMSLRGSIRTFNFTFDNGWRRPSATEGFGPRAGFGARVDTGELAGKIADFIRTNHKNNPVEWSDVVTTFPDVFHLVPEELDLLFGALKDYHGMSRNLDGDTQEVSVVQIK